MSDESKTELNRNGLGVVDSWLGSESKVTIQPTQPIYERRAQRLGLGAQYVPHKTVEETGSILMKKVMREKRRKREQMLENNAKSSDSDSAEETMSKANAVRSKVSHNAHVQNIKKTLTNNTKSKQRK